MTDDRLLKIYALLTLYSYPKRRSDFKSWRFDNYLFRNTRKVNLDLRILKPYKKIDELTTSKYVTFCNSSNREIIMSIRGTDFSLLEENDLFTDIRLVNRSHITREIFTKSYDNLKKIAETYPMYKIIVTGHSLGGRVAIDLLDSDVGQKITAVYAFNPATLPVNLFISAPCFQKKIDLNKRKLCKNRTKLHIHIINNDIMSILSLGEKSKTRRVHIKKKYSTRLTPSATKLEKPILNSHSLLNFI